MNLSDPAFWLNVAADFVGNVACFAIGVVAGWLHRVLQHWGDTGEISL